MFIVLKPTEYCNLKCSYCFIDEKPTIKRLTYSESINIIKSLYDYYLIDNKHKNLTICWHGGEPLTMGYPFYKSVFEGFEPFQTCNRLKQTIQTNLTLFDKDYCDLFQDYKISISTSLDGPEEIHNMSRKYRNNSGSFTDVMHGIDMAKSRGLDIGIICVLNKHNVQHIDTLYGFFKSLDLHFKVNFIHAVGRSNYDDTVISYKEYTKALLRFFELFMRDESPKKPETQSFRIARSILTKSNSACLFSKNCQNNIISINADGNVYPCESFPHIVDNEFVLLWKCP